MFFQKLTISQQSGELLSLQNFVLQQLEKQHFHQTVVNWTASKTVQVPFVPFCSFEDLEQMAPQDVHCLHQQLLFSWLQVFPWELKFLGLTNYSFLTRKAEHFCPLKFGLLEQEIRLSGFILTKHFINGSHLLVSDFCITRPLVQILADFVLRD